MFPKQIFTYGQLIDSGMKEGEIKKMCASLKLFPTPFKGIYYVPAREEREGWFIEKPSMVLTRAIRAHLGTDSFYCSCATAEEFWGMNWRGSPCTHVVNERLSGWIELKKRIERNLKKGTYRSKKVAHILSYYGDSLVFHKIKNVTDAKTKETPYGKFATKRQILIDRKRFGVRERCRD
ncbi:hypothetical protein COT30_02455 [Candidatus Micrarchaeota archaeon CG08_land_8_20_14_0_20_49_17]|nr:MAG: hypothetical protein AUJ13_00750 [Candidatus Micrarchaeota archaeon CG1_02_49_24]PIU09819.1 MAG: hypothetical protein COT30_02455 [Candidatus Micrarchaeota archaeon CG08_land_8_20_14_0_20_49_17]PIZ94155.1 MAG: hypothetical protein COX84_05490 [Candidatus Micrarchaeota archaeon CG_4_10_14_0_2_um_filter_49_7]HII53932.1 hypothetical protein [Candidatus Micrarchaeota archaeon]